MTILNDVRNSLGVHDSSFDHQLLGHINSVVGGIAQMGVESLDSIGEIDESTNWPTDTLPSSAVVIYKSLVRSKVKAAFDPSSNTAISSALNEYINEQTSRLSIYISEDEGYDE